MQNCYMETETTSCSSVASKQAGTTVISFQASQKGPRKQCFPIVLFTKLPISYAMFLHAVPNPECPVCLTSKTAIRH